MSYASEVDVHAVCVVASLHRLRLLLAQHAAYTAADADRRQFYIQTMHMEAGRVLSAVIDARQTWVLMLSAMQHSNDNAEELREFKQ